MAYIEVTLFLFNLLICCFRRSKSAEDVILGKVKSRSDALQLPNPVNLLVPMSGDTVAMPMVDHLCESLIGISLMGCSDLPRNADKTVLLELPLPRAKEMLRLQSLVSDHANEDFRVFFRV